MTQEISHELFDRLVQLAALELPPDQAKYLRDQLNKQLKAINELQAIPVEADTPIVSHGVPFTPEIRPAIRSDLWEPFPNPQDILDQAPNVEEGYVVVPEIPHEDLE
jgi:aspartyl/glutamyl-tRNA(Asn/Gln) amidotransferase C subunit